MPLISDFEQSKKNKKVFQKKAYRPWDSYYELNVAERLITLGDNNDTIKTSELHIDYDTTNVSIKDSLQSKTTNICALTFNLEKELRHLFGAQKIIIQYLVQQIEENYEEYVITRSISTEEFTAKCNIPANTVKGMLQKLKSKKLLETHENKPGRGGYARYKFKREVYDFFLQRLNV